MESVILFLCGFLGFVFHSGLKYKGLKDHANAGNVKFDVITYLKVDIVAIVLSFASIFIWFLVFGEITSKYPALEGFTRTSFVIMGAMGSYLIQLAFSVSQKRITAIISSKSNKSDDVIDTPVTEITKEAVENIKNS